MIRTKIFRFISIAIPTIFQPKFNDEATLMSDTDFRHGKKRFYDNLKFPRGFAKSGHFTLAEEEMLLLFGDTMIGLESGQLAPETNDEVRFIKVLNQPAKARSRLERVWLKYIKLARGRRRVHTLTGKGKSKGTDIFEEYGSSAELIMDSLE